MGNVLTETRRQAWEGESELALSREGSGANTSKQPPAHESDTWMCERSSDRNKDAEPLSP